MHSEHLAKSCEGKKKLLLVKNELKLQQTSCLHPAAKNHLCRFLKKQDPKNWMQRQRLVFMKMALLSSIQLLPQVLLS
jgi:hypothetical protein